MCFCVRSSLVELEKGIKGLVVMSSNLEETFTSIHDGRVPPLWEKVTRLFHGMSEMLSTNVWGTESVKTFVCAHQAYPSLKPLAAWTRDLCQRVSQFQMWAETTQPPKLFWLSGFTFPNGFLTAVLQSYARQQNVSSLVSAVALKISGSPVRGPGGSCWRI